MMSNCVCGPWIVDGVDLPRHGWNHRSECPKYREYWGLDRRPDQPPATSLLQRAVRRLRR